MLGTSNFPTVIVDRFHLSRSQKCPNRSFTNQVRRKPLNRNFYLKINYNKRYFLNQDNQ